MEAKQEQKISKKEFERLSAEIRELVGNKLKAHKDGDAEQLLLEKSSAHVQGIRLRQDILVPSATMLKIRAGSPLSSSSLRLVSA